MAIPGGSVLLGRHAVALVLFLLRHYIATTSHRNGISEGAGLSDAMRELRDALDAAVSDAGPPDVREESHQSVSDQSVRADDLIDVKEAAGMLQMTDRHVRRLVTQGESLGPVQRAGRSILVRRAEVLAYIAHRAEKSAR